MDKIEFLTELAKLRTSSTFLTLVGYRNEYSEVADYSILFHMDYANACRKSIQVMEKYVPTDHLQTLAKAELLSSFRRSLRTAETTLEVDIDDAYSRFIAANGTYIKGVKMHTKTGILHLYGLLVHKRVTMPGIYPDSTGSELVQVKRHLRKMCPLGKFRQFRITPFQVERISVENLSLLPPQ